MTMSAHGTVGADDGRLMRFGFTIHWNGPAARCVGHGHSRCESFWAAVKHYHMVKKGWSDIAYSFGVCPHGVRFEGRGWVKSQFANGADQVGPDDGGDKYWYTVLTFLGVDTDTGIAEQPTPEMVAGVRDLIDEGRKSGRCGSRVLPHNAFKKKSCPGTEFTIHAKAWDNNNLAGDEDMPLSTTDLDAIGALFDQKLREHLGTGTKPGENPGASSVIGRMLARMKQSQASIAGLIRSKHPDQ